MKKISQEKLNILINNHNLYFESMSSDDTKGIKLILDEIDFTDNDLSDLNFVEVYITSSLFKNMSFENINFGGSELYSCHFDNVTFNNANFGKTVLDYAEIKNSRFCNSNLSSIETYEAVFKNVIFECCEFNGVFSHSKVKNVIFSDCHFKGTEFWKCIIKNLEFINMRNFSIEYLIKELNTGTFENAKFISNKDAVNYFMENITVS